MNDLLTLLSENARLTAAQLAVMLNKTEAEVAAAVKSYEESGVIKGYKALIDWDKAPVKSASAIIELKVTPKKETGARSCCTVIWSRCSSGTISSPIFTNRYA